jgi:hypothetical protein
MARYKVTVEKADDTDGCLGMIGLAVIGFLMYSYCGTPSTETQTPTEAVVETASSRSDMDDAIDALYARSEVADSAIVVQHILIAFQGVPIPGVTRSKVAAKILAEQVWKEALGGADFKALMKQHSNDSAGGEYPMTKAGRMQMVKGFGDVGFRLAVGEIGVAPWDEAASPYGWHIIKRVK